MDTARVKGTDVWGLMSRLLSGRDQEDRIQSIAGSREEGEAAAGSQKFKDLSWRDSSGVKSPGYFGRGPGFSSQAPTW